MCYIMAEFYANAATMKARQRKSAVKCDGHSMSTTKRKDNSYGCCWRLFSARSTVMLRWYRGTAEALGIPSAGLIMLTRMAYKVYTKTVLITDLKVYSNELFLFQLTNDLCTSFTKLIIILFLSKAVFIKKTLLFQYFVLKIEPP